MGSVDDSGGASVSRPPGPALAVSVAGICCANPVWTASGCGNYGRELGALFPLAGLGAIVVKGTSPEPWGGNPGPRLAETAAGMLNAIGLQNPGIRHFLEVDLPYLVGERARVVANIVGRTVDEYAAVARRLGEAPAGAIAGVELNISCPNVKEGGIQFGNDLGAAREVTAAVRASTRLPLLVKLSPNVTDVRAFAAAVVEAGADAISLINTLVGMRLDARKRAPVLANTTGGLSGPAIKPIALRMVWEVAGAVDVPVVGIGGIETGEDAAEFLLAGARAVQVGTAIFRDPWAPIRIRDELSAWLAAQGVADVGDIVGAARPRA